jgi:hypothetical protein
VDTFNACAVSDKKCVPQRADEGLYPIPPDCALDTSFDLSNFQGRWFITAGLNPLFDIFDCQVRFEVSNSSAAPSTGKQTFFSESLEIDDPLQHQIIVAFDAQCKAS